MTGAAAAAAAATSPTPAGSSPSGSSVLVQQSPAPGTTGGTNARANTPTTPRAHGVSFADGQTPRNLSYNSPQPPSAQPGKNVIMR